MKHYRAHAKVNVFLKITGKRGEYHTLSSRFVRVEDLYDTLYLRPKSTSEFLIDGECGCDITQNTIYKAYNALLSATHSTRLVELMRTHAVVVEKRIPSCAGLGGGSSDAATFLHLCNETLHLGLSISELLEIGARVGADVPFFIHNYPSANVRGIGEIVEPFEEEPLCFEIMTPPIALSTPCVYRYYRDHLYAPFEGDWEARSSRDILTHIDPLEANDLYRAALGAYSELSVQEGWFFSGSGSSFFRLR